MTKTTNYVSAEFPVERSAELVVQIQGMRTGLGFLVSWTAADRTAALKLGDEAFEATAAMAEVVEQYQDQFPKDVVDAAELRRDVALARGLAPVSRALRALADAIDDTILAARSDAFRAALQAYGLAKFLTKTIPGLRKLVEPLQKVFDRPGRPRSTGKQAPA
jgi:hypothetical protein